MLHIKLAQFAVPCALPPRRSESPVCATDYKPSCVLHLLGWFIGSRGFSSLERRPEFWVLQSHSFLFACVGCAFGGISKNSLPRPMSMNIFLMFPTRSFTVSGLMDKSLIHPMQVNFCEWWKTGVQFHSFACEYPVFPISLIEWNILSPLSILGPLWGFISGMCLFWWKYHSELITRAL